MFATMVLVVLNFVLYGWQHVFAARDGSRSDWRIASQELEMTGNAVVGNSPMGLSPYGRLHVLVTASFNHASLPHLVNNMLMLLPPSVALEDRVGSLALIILYVLCGVTGWFATLANTKIKNREAWNSGVAQWQPSVGSSPSTYGICAASGAILGPFESDLGIWGVPAFLWVALLVFAPPFLGDYYGLSVLSSSGRHSWARVFQALCFVVAPITALLFFFVPENLHAASWFLIYLTARALERAVTYVHRCVFPALCADFNSLVDAAPQGF
jgi:membrane associated rhomboid family serine protease